MDDRIKSLINRIKAQLMKMYGGKIKKIILYGSYVRGDSTRDSDIDVLVLIDQSLNPFQVRDSLSDLLFDILLEDGEHISVIVVPESFYDNYNSPFILNVKKEGVVA